MLHNIHLLDAEILLRPSEISEESENLIVRVQIASHELTKPEGKRHRGDQQGHDAGIQKTTEIERQSLSIKSPRKKFVSR